MLPYGIPLEFRCGVHLLFKPPYAIRSVPSLSGHALFAYRRRSLPGVHRHRASKPQGSSERVLPWQVTMDQLKCIYIFQFSTPTFIGMKWLCVFSSHPFWTSSSLDVPAGVTQEEGHTGFLIHLPSAVRALLFVARRIQPFLSLVDREVEFCVLMMTTIVEVFGEFGLTVSEKKTETLLMRAPEKQPKKGGSPPPPLVIEAAGQKYAQTTQFRYLGGLVNEDGELTQEINHRSRAAWACIRRFSRELFDRPRAPWRLKVRLLRAEAMEALLYGCMTWAPRREHYRLLRRTHHRLLLRVIGYRRERGTYRQLSYAQALKKTGCQSVEATIRQRRLLFAGAMARQPAGRLPKRLMDGKLVGWEDPGKGRPEQNWMDCLKDDFQAFGATDGSTVDNRLTFGVDRAV